MKIITTEHMIRLPKMQKEQKNVLSYGDYDKDGIIDEKDSFRQ